jgi:hypothetical protein
MRTQALKWRLHELLRVERDLAWLPADPQLEEDWDPKRAQIGDYVVVVQQVRNLDDESRESSWQALLRFWRRRFRSAFTGGCRNRLPEPGSPVGTLANINDLPSQT